MIGIHDSPGSFSDHWIERCIREGIPFARLNCLATDLLHRCSGCEAILWQWSHINPAEPLLARQVIAALERKGIVVFPNFDSCWHYDDKVGQKYLLEAIGAPLIPTWVFTNPDEASRWIAEASWPKIFKLRCGAGSNNVRMVSSRRQAETICRRAFGRGFAAQPGYLDDLRTRIRNTQSLQQLWQKLRRVPKNVAFSRQFRLHSAIQQGYLYFQEFLPGNSFDTRVTIIGDKAFAFLRMNRPNDFRASGSGRIVYDSGRIDKRCLELAFQVATTLGTQSLAFDFLFDQNLGPMICEISYCYKAEAVHACPGHWDRNLCWHEGPLWPQDLILNDVLATIQSERKNSDRADGLQLRAGSSAEVR